MRHRRVRCASLPVPSSSKAARSSRAATTTTVSTTIAPRCVRGGTASPYRCTRRRTPYSASQACLRPSASSRIYPRFAISDRVRRRRLRWCGPPRVKYDILGASPAALCCRRQLFRCHWIKIANLRHLCQQETSH
jgi:hypothetical protein